MCSEENYFSQNFYDCCDKIFPSIDIDTRIVNNTRDCVTHHVSLGSRNLVAQTGLNTLLAGVTFCAEGQEEDKKELSSYAIASRRLSTSTQTILNSKKISRELIVENKTFSQYEKKIRKDFIPDKA